MAIDLEALRRKHEQLNNPQAGNNNADFLQKFYQIPEGSNPVRILPWKDETKSSTQRLKSTESLALMAMSRTFTAVRCMARTVPCVIFITRCGRQVEKRTRTWLVKSSLALVTI